MATSETQDDRGDTGSLSARVLSDTTTNAIPISRHELAVAVVVTLVGFSLRVAFPSRLAVEHFDEGVYASNLFFDASQGYRFPNQHLYAPPLLPWLIEWVFILFGPSNVGAMVPSIIAGSLTVPLMWWVGRRWFGPTAGLAAAILCATNDIHILFSRSALTDVLLCFWLLLAVYLFWEAITRNHFGWAVAAGVATSLAWWTKYSGWLPLAITSAGLALCWLLDRRTRAHWKRHLTCWLITAAVATLLWLPWLWSLQPLGGYSAVRANHRGYFVGWRGWRESSSALGRKLQHLEHLPTFIGWSVAFGLTYFTIQRVRGERFTWNERISKAELRPPWRIFFGLMILWVSWRAIAVVALLVITMLINILRMASKRLACGSFPQLLAFSMASVWLIGLALVTPTYHPYPRLVLPLLMVSQLGLGWLLDRWLSHFQDCYAAFRRAHAHEARQFSRLQLILTALAFIWLVIIVFAVLTRRQFPPKAQRDADDELTQAFPILGWQPRIGLHDIADACLTDSIRESGLNRETGQSPLVFYVYGEPALVFQLRLAGVAAVGPVEHLAFAQAGEPPSPVPVFLVTGPHAERNPNFARQFDEVKSRLRPVQEYDYQPSDLVWRDERSTIDKRPTHRIRLYRVQ